MMELPIDEKMFGRKCDRLPIDEACRQMLLFAYTALRQFPKSEKHGLAAEIRDSMWRIQRLVVAAIKKHHKKTAVAELCQRLRVTGESMFFFWLRLQSKFLKRGGNHCEY
jgi:hypothetical protein